MAPLPPWRIPGSPAGFSSSESLQNWQIDGGNWAGENARSHIVAILWEIRGESGEREDEEVMTSSAPAVGWSESSGCGPEQTESHLLLSREERGKTHVREGGEREAPDSKEFQPEFYFVYPLLKLFVTLIIHRKLDHLSLGVSN